MVQSVEPFIFRRRSYGSKRRMFYCNSGLRHTITQTPAELWSNFPYTSTVPLLTWSSNRSFAVKCNVVRHPELAKLRKPHGFLYRLGREWRTAHVLPFRWLPGKTPSLYLSIYLGSSLTLVGHRQSGTREARSRPRRNTVHTALSSRLQELWEFPTRCVCNYERNGDPTPEIMHSRSSMLTNREDNGNVSIRSRG